MLEQQAKKNRPVGRFFIAAKLFLGSVFCSIGGRCGCGSSGRRGSRSSGVSFRCVFCSIGGRCGCGSSGRGRSRSSNRSRCRSGFRFFFAASSQCEGSECGHEYFAVHFVNPYVDWRKAYFVIFGASRSYEFLYISIILRRTMQNAGGSGEATRGRGSRAHRPEVVAETAGSELCHISSKRSRIVCASFSSFSTRTPRACAHTLRRTK